MVRYAYRLIRNYFILLIAKTFSKRLVIHDNVLIISPHPDDEILGCGGIIAAQNKRGKSVSIIFMTKGENVNENIVKEIIVEERNKLTRKALSSVGHNIEKCYFLDYPDGGVSYNHPETNKLNLLIKQIKPQVIYVPNLNDGWNDHVQANQIVHSLIKNTTIQLYEYCVWFWYTMPFKTVFSIDWHQSLIFKMKRDEQKRKKRAIEIYMEAKDLEGRPYSGNLPKVLLKSCSWKSELYFCIKI